MVILFGRHSFIYSIFFEKNEQVGIINGATIFFIISVVAYSLLGIVCKLYLAPRAEDARRKELLSNAIGVELIHERTSLYYNNEEKEPFRRLGMILFENTFFTMKVLQKMVVSARIKVIAYFLIWIFVLLYRDASLETLSIVTTVVFSEEIISRWFRLEWQRIKTEHIFDNI